MKLILPAIIIWACFFLFSCTRFEQEYNHGSLKFTINDTVVQFNGDVNLKWYQTTTYDLDIPTNQTEVGIFKISGNQFDTSTVFGCEGVYQTSPNIQPHSYMDIHGYGPPGTFEMTLHHPTVGASYGNWFYMMDIYVNEFSPSRINGYFYGDLHIVGDTSMVYVTCDFDFTP